jgi:MFS family permease
MITVFRPIMQVLLGVVLMELALGAVGPLIGVQLVQRGVATGLIGVVTSAYFVGFLAGSLTCHQVIDRVGHIRAFCVFAVIATNATLLHIILDPPWAWMALRAITGYSLAGQFLVIESWINDKATATTRGRVFATYLVLTWGASGVGPLLLNVTDPGSYLPFVVIAMGFAFALLPMALTTTGNPDIGGRSHFGAARLFQISPLGVIACFGAGLGNSAFYGLAPVYVNGVGLEPRHLSVLVSVAILGGLTAQFPIGMLADRFGRRPIMLAALGGALALAILLLLQTRPSFTVLVALFFVYGGMTAPLYALGVGQTNDYIERKDFVAASGGLLFAWALGASAGPNVGAWIIAWLGPQGLFVYLIGVMAVIAGFTVYRMVRRPAPPVEQQGKFVGAAPEAARARTLDPRGAASADQPGA